MAANALPRQPTRFQTGRDNGDKCLKAVFEMYSGGSNMVAEKDIHRMFGVCGSGLLKREIDEWIEEMRQHATSLGHEFLGVEWSHVKARFSKPGTLLSSWEREAVDDRLMQIFAATKMLTDHKGEKNKIDTQAVEFALQSCGEELAGDAWYDVMKISHHGTKGRFDIAKIVTAYADLAVKVGRFEEGADGMIDQVVAERQQLFNKMSGQAAAKQGGGRMSLFTLPDKHVFDQPIERIDSKEGLEKEGLEKVSDDGTGTGI
jgi:hypothetical protein